MTELPYERSLREWVQARGMRYERLVYPRPAVGGETVAYRLAPAAAPDGIVLIGHGAGNDALFAFVGFFKRLLLRGLEVFAFDLDGHGRASTTTLAYPGICSALGDARERALAGRDGLPVHAFGLSLGGSILLHALAGPLAGAASAVLVSAPLTIHLSLGRALNELRPRLFATLAEQHKHGGAWGSVPSFGPFKRGVYPLRLAENRPGMFGYVEALNEMLERMRLLERAAEAAVPTLLVYGTADRIVPLEQGQRLVRTLPNAKLSVVAGGTHLTTVFDRRATEEVLEWIGSEPSRVLTRQPPLPRR